MSDQFSEELQGLKVGSLITITLNANTADIVAGGNGEAATIVLKDEQGSEIARLGKITGAKITPSVVLHLKDAGGQTRISLNGSTGDAVFGGNGADGDLSIRNQQSNVTIALDGESAHITAGGAGKNGTLVLNDANGQTRFYLGSSGTLRVGGNGVDGDVYVLPEAAGVLTEATIHLDGETGSVILKSAGEERFRMNPSTGKLTYEIGGQQRLLIEGNSGNIRLGGNAADGDLLLFAKEATDTADATKASIHLDGQTGDIVLRNADCAEEFDIAESDPAELGTVMVLGSDGRLHQSRQAYDPKVAGVLSGAGDYRPALVLDRQLGTRRMPVALVGKAYCKVDADHGPIEVGDLLTSSPTPGHAMKATDTKKAFGAVIGKALRSIATGTGLIPVLIALQ